MSGYKNIWSVVGGTSGIGKSVVTANIGCVLAGMGKNVVLVDADPGGYGLHTYLGIKHPPGGLADFLAGRLHGLEDGAVETQVKGLRLISGAREFTGMADPAFAQRQKLISQIKKLEADYIIADLGEDSSYNTLDFFAISAEGIVVLTPEPASIKNSYIFLKNFVYRRLLRVFSENPLIADLIRDATDSRGKESVRTFADLCERINREDQRSAERAISEIRSFRPKLILNMAASDEDLDMVDAFAAASSAFLSLDTEFIGAIHLRPSIEAASGKMRLFMLDDAASDARRDMEAVVSNLLGTGPREREPEKGRALEAAEARQEVFGFNDNVNHMGTVFHVQTEVQGGPRSSVETIIYQGGRIFFSKKAMWDDVSGNDPHMNIRDFAARQHRTAMAAIKMNKITVQGCP